MTNNSDTTTYGDGHTKPTPDPKDNDNSNKDPLDPIDTVEVKTQYTSTEVTKIWDDEENQDGKRPNSIKVQLYKTVDGTTSSMGDSYKETLSASNEWKKTWSSLLAGTYTVKELKPDGTTAIADGGQYNNDYTVVTYKAGDENNETIIEILYNNNT